ncbi:Kelch repeat-containing protein [Hyalangium versicolor]|uniref:Kelch repeat-containing protein n=1 Tax=Hyalangium versicolor TaxID=2861190 RepID=UPI001CCA995C|nr:kelch repeat-containing protein [Hyalangium versicolor]
MTRSGLVLMLAFIAGCTADKEDSPGPGQSASQSLSTTGTMLNARSSHAAVLLASGKVLVTGGTGATDDIHGARKDAELYDPATGLWTPAGTMNEARITQSAVLLPSGKAMVLGHAGFSSTAELYDPASGTWALTGPMRPSRQFPGAVVLPSGKVLVAGGDIGDPKLPGIIELYDETTGAWSEAPPAPMRRNSPAVALLPTGKVLVSEWYYSEGAPVPSALYDPATSTWSSAGSVMPRPTDYTATVLPSGQVLFLGGTMAQLYEPATGTWRTTQPMAEARMGHTATLLPSGEVLVVGGYGEAGRKLATVELYDPTPGTNHWRLGPSLPEPRASHSATVLPSGQVLIAGGSGTAGNLASALLYTP